MPHPEGVRLRRMTGDDLPSVLAVEEASHPEPWSATMLRDSLDHGDACRVAEESGRIVGHAILRVTGPEAEVLNLSVHPHARRRGLGRALLRDQLRTAAASGAQEVYLEVRAGNRAARALYEAEGFHRVGWREAYYRTPQGPEDAIIMARILSPADAPAPAGADR
jgi:ribosomal-protein-alanine N-acetyltransferase